MCKGLQAKHSHVAGCLVEERRPLTARWPFPNLAGIHSRFLGPAKKSIIKSYRIYIICTIQVDTAQKMCEAKAGQRTNLKSLKRAERCNNAFAKHQTRQLFQVTVSIEKKKLKM